MLPPSPRDLGGSVGWPRPRQRMWRRRQRQSESRAHVGNASKSEVGWGLRVDCDTESHSHSVRASIIHKQTEISANKSVNAIQHRILLLSQRLPKVRKCCIQSMHFETIWMISHVQFFYFPDTEFSKSTASILLEIYSPSGPMYLVHACRLNAEKIK